MGRYRVGSFEATLRQPFVQLPPFKQGDCAQLLRLTSQRGPPQSGPQLQLGLPMPSTQVPLTHGLGEQSSMFVSQVAPLKPGAQVQLKPLSSLAQAPPLWQCVLSQLSIR